MNADSQSLHLDDLMAHAAWVRSLATSLVRDPDAAEDVVQETWIAALRTPPRDSGEGGNLRAWLGRVVRNAVYDRNRKSARRSVHENAAVEDRDDVPSAEDLAARVETQRGLAAHVLALEEPLRQTVLLRYYEGLSSAEIARRTKVPAGTVRWRLKRGLELLRGRLDDGYGSRHDWTLALAPLLRPGLGAEAALKSGAPTAIGGASGIPVLLQGLLAMNLGLKIALTAGVVLAATILTPLGGRVLRSVPGLGVVEPEAEAVTFLQLEKQEPRAVVARLTLPEQESRTAVLAPQPVEESPTAGAVATIVDPAGQPVSAAVSIRGFPDTRVETSAQGQVHVALPDDWSFERSREASLYVDAPGYVVTEATFMPEAGRTVALGALEVQPAGEIHGLVVDAAGQPVAAAWVEIDDAPRRSSKLEEKRLDKSASPSGDVRTDSAGRFVLERVPVGRRVVWAAAPGQLAANSGPVEVRQGYASTGVTLELGLLDPEDFIRGVVLDPNGEPVSRAEVRMSYRSLFRKGSSSFNTDRDGRFLRAWAPAEPMEVRAWDREGAYTAALAEGVRGSADDLVLRLHAPEPMTLEVRGPAGLISDPTVVVWNEERKRPLVDTNTVKVEGTSVTFAKPLETFIIEAWAEGHAAASAGPFSGLSAPDVHTLNLAALPGVHGIVLAGEEGSTGEVAVPNATVELYRAASHFHSKNGFPLRVDPSSVQESRSTEDGSFLLTLRESGTFYVRASADGYAPMELGPLDIDHGVGLQGLEIRLDQGGALEGRVDAGGASAAGTIVAISRGDGHARTQRVGVDGEYRFERLTPGDWLVVRRDEEIVAGTSSSSSDSYRSFKKDTIETNCTVVAGQTTRFDLRLPGAGEEARLVGRLLLNGEAPKNWTAALRDRPDATTPRQGERKPVLLAADGSFELKAPTAGPSRLALQSPDAEVGRGPVYSVDLELLPGTNTWSDDLETGTLRIENPNPPHEAGTPLDFLFAERDGLQVLAMILPDPESGETVLTDLPAGPAKIVRFTLEELSTLTDYPRERSGLVEFEVAAGETVEIRLP